MELLLYVFEKVIFMMTTWQFTFGEYSFTMWQFFITVIVLGICIGFIKNIFDW